MKNNVEEALTSTREECLRMINESVSDDGRKAWYYTHCGEIEMAFNLGLISLERFNELHAEWQEHCPA